MKLDRIELFHVVRPLDQPFRPSWVPGYVQPEARFTLLRVTTDDGHQGLAAGIASGIERQEWGPQLAWYLGDVDPTDTAHVHDRLQEATLFGWRNLWAEAAFWDIRGKAEGMPIWALLGGHPVQRVEVYASTGEIHPPHQRAEEVIGLHEMGFKTVKLRVHSFDSDEDIAQVAAVRRAVGAEMGIGVDANQAWRISVTGRSPIWSLDRAIDFAHACADLDVIWLEEPLDMHAYDELAELRCRATVPIAGGEANNGWHEFKVMLEKGSYDIYQPDATFGGGITDGWRVLKVCRERGLAFTPHTWTNGIGFMVNLHLYVAGDRSYPLEYPYEPPGWIPKVRDVLLAEPIQVDAEGKVPVPQVPGLGIDLDEEQLAHYGEKFFDWSPGQ